MGQKKTDNFPIPGDQNMTTFHAEMSGFSENTCSAFIIKLDKNVGKMINKHEKNSKILS